MLYENHYVELRDDHVLKLFASGFSDQVERYITLHRLLDGVPLSGAWRARVPALTQIDPETSSVVMTRAPGGTVYHAIERGQEVPWAAIGATLGHLHRASSVYVHGDAAPNNIMFCPRAREVWLIDPAVQATGSPWQDVLTLQWVIFRRCWGLKAATDLFRGWRTARGTADLTDIDEGWAAVLAGHFHHKPSLLWARRAVRWAFRYMWVPLALHLSR